MLLKRPTHRSEAWHPTLFGMVVCGELWVRWLKLVANRRQILNGLKSNLSRGLLAVGACGSEMEALNAVVLPFGTLYLSYGPVVERSHEYPKFILLEI